MPAGAESALVIISQTFMLILLVAMVYSKLWERGDKDNNRVNFNRMPEDKLRGLKVGLMAAIPSFAFYLLLVVSKLGLITDKYFALYRFLNISFMPIINRLAGAGVSSSRDVSWVSFLVILLTLSVVPLAAHSLISWDTNRFQSAKNHLCKPRKTQKTQEEKVLILYWN